MKRSSSVRASCISSCICVSIQRPHRASSSLILTMASSVSSSKVTSPNESLQHTRWHLSHSVKNSLGRPDTFRSGWHEDYDFILINQSIVQTIILLRYPKMKFCSNCNQYHNHTCGSGHTCFTYEKFTYLLKDEFMRWNHEETKLSKMTEKSKNNPPKIDQKPKETIRPFLQVPVRDLGRTQKSTVSSNVRTRHRPNQEILNKRIQKVIAKSRGIHKECNHMRSTSCDEDGHFYSIEIEQRLQQTHKKQDDIEVESLLEHETDLQLTIIPCENLFKKPFNSRLLANPVVYDSLYDNRLCGAAFCEEGEIVTDSRGINIGEILKKMEKEQ